MKSLTTLLTLAALIAPLLAQAPSFTPPAPKPATAARVKVTPLAEGFHLVTGAGCNITVSSGEDGLLLVDTGMPSFKEDLKGALVTLSPRPVRVVLNTNWHYDHADGNAWLAEAGALVVAHEDSRAHMTREIRGADRILALADANTRIVPGHGTVSGREQVKAFRDLLTDIRDRLAAQLAAGKSVDEVVAANPLADLYKGRRSYFKAENLTRYACLELQQAKPEKQPAAPLPGSKPSPAMEAPR